jgi:hypothetical protein
MALVNTTQPSDLSRTLKTRLAGGMVAFTFTKLDGTPRPANGTTVIDLIPQAFRPIGTGKPRNPDLIAYFDTDCMAWRSCKADRIVSIDD